ncbi:MAG: superoxide dismutase family protein [Sphingomonas sp.]|uniref:superoxide dismutase family protein n=1 Tax=Sphingomonas sp. TaxID=28214 RepID=UPI002600DA66|nr:superoxide dismutase family protein [Sphingomonas sp.]MBX3566070.1 superoxide dismutase family protein [Sphingomonas sp.]
MRGLAVAAVAGLMVAGCVSAEKNARYMAGHFRAQADLATPDGTPVGTAVAEEIDGDIRVIVEAKGMAEGVHGVHIHAVGKCEGPDFASAGGHWNPTAHQHGKENPMGPHMGDLPNLNLNKDGRGQITFTVKGGTFAGLMDQDGAALVVHAGEDDYKTDPSGNSGGRIACGVFQAR